MATITKAASATADHKIEIVPPSIRDSETRGLLRRIMRRVRQVMAAMLPETRQIEYHPNMGQRKSAMSRVSLHQV